MVNLPQFLRWGNRPDLRCKQPDFGFTPQQNRGSYFQPVVHRPGYRLALNAVRLDGGRLAPGRRSVLLFAIFGRAGCPSHTEAMSLGRNRLSFPLKLGVMGNAVSKNLTPKEFGPESVLEYLSQFLAQSEAGLIIGETHQSIRVLRALLRSRAMVEAHSAEDALTALVQGCSAFMVLTPPLDTQLYFLLCQYAEKSRTIRLMNRRSLELSCVTVEPSMAHLLLLVAKDDLNTIEERHPIRSKIGPIERFS